MVLLAIFGVMTLGIHNLQKSSSGRAALAVRSSSVAARTSGIAPARSEIALFALAGGIAGFGGVMLGMTNGSFTNTSATPITGLLWLAVVVTFGIRRPGGALLGGLAVMATTPDVPVDLGMELHARLVQRPQQLHLLRVDHVRPRRHQPGQEPRRAVRADRQSAAREATGEGARGAGRAGGDRPPRGRARARQRLRAADADRRRPDAPPRGGGRGLVRSRRPAGAHRRRRTRARRRRRRLRRRRGAARRHAAPRAGQRRRAARRERGREVDAVRHRRRPAHAVERHRHARRAAT